VVRVLQLEDSPLDAELVLATLQDGGLEVEATRVETRIDYAGALENAIDVILADYSLPSFDGIAALDMARERRPEVPFIFVSGALGEELAIETLKRGATDYVLKERLGRLPSAVRRALRLAEEQAARRRAEQERSELLVRERSARAEAEAANRLKDEFLATVSHELRTPLNAVLGWLHMLQTGKLSEPEAARAIETIYRNAKAQAQLIEDLLDISRVITGSLRLEVRPVALAEVVEAAVEAISPAAQAKEVRLQVVIDPMAGPVSGDSGRLQQVVWNLVSNAIKFTPRGGRVQVRLERLGSDLEIVVSDTGQGISPAFLPYIFDRFRQADGTSSRAHRGLGLGLAIVRHLVELHGGSVHADSPGQGRGATFTVRLPLMVGRVAPYDDLRTHPTAEVEALPQSTVALSGVRVLVVDDEEDTREWLVTLLEKYGASVETAASAAEALEAVTDHELDVLVSDIEMPVEDGYTLIRKVRALGAERGGRIPAAALTAYARTVDRQRALAAGYQIHVPKPVEPAELVTVVASLVGRTGKGTARDA
jgi:signal transduction histidine kinase